MIDLPEDESLLKTLTSIYADVFRNPNEVIDTDLISKRYNLGKDDCNSLVNEWNALARNMQLKGEIMAW